MCRLNKMSSRPPITDELKKLLRSMLLSKAGGVELNRIVADYAKFVGKPLPYKQCGFDNVQSFLQAVPEVAQYAVSFIILLQGVSIACIAERCTICHFCIPVCCLPHDGIVSK